MYVVPVSFFLHDFLLLSLLYCRYKQQPTIFTVCCRYWLVGLMWQVRDIYDAGDYLVLVTTDRQSAFDRVLASIPFKGQVTFLLYTFISCDCR